MSLPQSNDPAVEQSRDNPENGQSQQPQQQEQQSEQLIIETNKTETKETEPQTTTSRVISSVGYYSGKVLAGAEYVGEALASFFGITDSKYQFILDEHNMKEEEKKRKLEKEAELASKMETGELTSTDDINSNKATHVVAVTPPSTRRKSDIVIGSSSNQLPTPSSPSSSITTV
eukprot:gene4138-5178_t